MKHVLQYGAAGVEDMLVACAVRCPVYDPQCEESRADWIVDMVSHAGFSSRVIDGIRDDADVALEARPFWDRDHRIIERVLTPIEDDCGRHALLDGVLDVFGTDPVPESANSLRFAYEFTPCSNCRLRALKMLANLGALPDWLAEEALLDASEAIRAFVEERDDSQG